MMIARVFSLRNPQKGFCIIPVYVDDLNIIGNKNDINEAGHHLKTEFEMKDLDKTKFCLGLQLEYLPSEILYTKRLIYRKYWRNSIWTNYIHLKPPMMVMSLDMEKDPFRPQSNEEEILGLKFSYLSTIGAFMYLAKVSGWTLQLQ